MSEDEMFVGLGAIACVAVVLRKQAVPLFSLSRAVAPLSIRGGVALAFALALALTHYVVATLSSWDVQSSSLYTGFYDLLGLAWLGLAVLAMHWLGLSLRDDVLERRNVAALAAFGGALVGHALAYAGGNIGDGPGWWCVAVASGLASATLFGVWVVLHFAEVSDHVTVDRDLPSGIRAGALLVACGYVFGRGAAGDWISMEDTVASFFLAAWPAFILVGVAAGIERLLTPARPIPARLAISGALAAGYLAAGALIVEWEGPLW
ncbi:MAG: hypothetical protein H6719_29340 [Sandaracinaceae bacterium]|nr:hypothetical protein [Sandaracinaceae bacterium]